MPSAAITTIFPPSTSTPVRQSRVCAAREVRTRWADGWAYERAPASVCGCAWRQLCVPTSFEEKFARPSAVRGVFLVLLVFPDSTFTYDSYQQTSSFSSIRLTKAHAHQLKERLHTPRTASRIKMTGPWVSAFRPFCVPISARKQPQRILHMHPLLALRLNSHFMQCHISCT